MKRGWPILTALLIFSYVYGILQLSWSPDWSFTLTYHIFDVDEFGRDILAAAIVAMVNSMVAAVALTLFSFMVAGGIALGAFLVRFLFLRSLVINAGTLIESCPILIWLFVILVGFHEYPRPVIVLITFILAATPYITNVLTGELERLWHADFVEAARISGAGDFRIVSKYIFANALPVLSPVFINVSGAALTVNGVIGLLGMGNRMDLEIGTLLLRGKESITTCPQIMLLSIVALVAVFSFVMAVGRRIEHRFERGDG
jgi:peptide/nickel transport system permease protein